MRIDTLSPAKGATKESKRLGRGIGSGTGKTSGKQAVESRYQGFFTHLFGCLFIRKNEAFIIL